jgi:hypothetical protein
MPGVSAPVVVAAVASSSLSALQDGMLSAEQGVHASPAMQGVAAVAPVRGESEKIDFFWSAFMITTAGHVCAPEYKLHISERIALKDYRCKKL